MNKQRKNITICVIAVFLFLILTLFLLAVIRNQQISKLEEYETKTVQGSMTVPLHVDDFLNLEPGESVTLDDGATFTRMEDPNKSNLRFRYNKIFGLDGTEECKLKVACYAFLDITLVDGEPYVISVLCPSNRLVSSPALLNFEWVSQNSYGALEGKDNEFINISGFGYFKVALGNQMYWTSPSLSVAGNYKIL